MHNDNIIDESILHSLQRSSSGRLYKENSSFILKTDKVDEIEKEKDSKLQIFRKLALLKENEINNYYKIRRGDCSKTRVGSKQESLFRRSGVQFPSIYPCLLQEMNPSNFPILCHLLHQQDPKTYPPLPTQLHQSLLTRFPHLSDPKLLSWLSHTLGPPHALLQQEDCRATEERLVEAYEAQSLHEDASQGLIAILRKAQSQELQRVDLSASHLTILPEAFSKIRSLVVLNLSQNQLEGLPGTFLLSHQLHLSFLLPSSPHPRHRPRFPRSVAAYRLLVFHRSPTRPPQPSPLMIPDSIAGLQKLVELDISSNILGSLPDSIGLLVNLKVLNVSANKLSALPESIALCRALVELDASFNNIMCMPTNMGFGLVNLEKLLIHLNKIRILPTSIGEMKSLRHLDVHFNQLHGLPQSIGKLTNLEYLNLSSNFSDMTELPETLGDLVNLRELDVSNNQIRALPYTFSRLENLTKLNLDQNPIIVPPIEVVNEGVEVVKEFMAKWWLDLIEEAQQKSMAETKNQQAQTGWLAWGASLLNNVAEISESVAEYFASRKAPRDPWLDQQL
ncbi:hypothetical protein Fmac_001392 [Flemingia macrophylla]|uniref:Disease resistance R13L4/SHOC-2-like LRR domain-containing protein n=1 Tax=Flemingia macrophylla TaxID=520843 RepID=A0ABD1NGZ5_9FABA